MLNVILCNYFYTGYYCLYKNKIKYYKQNEKLFLFIYNLLIENNYSFEIYFIKILLI
jgi:hypothetical protein